MLLNKDVIRMILEIIDDERDFYNVANVNPYFRSQCDETLYYRKISRKFPDIVQHKNNMSYKQLYEIGNNYIKKLKIHYKFIYSSEKSKGDPISYYNILSDILQLRFLKIKQAIRNHYNDLAIFLSDKENVNNRMFSGLLRFSIECNNEEMVKYYNNRDDFTLVVYTYEQLYRIARIKGHIELSKYLKSLC